MGQSLVSAVPAVLSVLVPVGTPVVAVQGTPRRTRTRIPNLWPGEQLVLLDDRRWSPRRVRRLAREAGLVVDRELAVLPSMSEAAFVVEDAAESLSWCWRTFATVPPGRCSGAFLLTAATRLAGHPALLRCLGHLVRGRIVIAHRP